MKIKGIKFDKVKEETKSNDEYVNLDYNLPRQMPWEVFCDNKDIITYLDL